MKQFHEVPADAHVVQQRILEVFLAEGRADLAHVLGVGTQDHDLAARQVRAEHELVESVVFDAAMPDLIERLLEDLLDHGDVHLAARAVAHRIVVYPDHPAVAHVDFVRTL